MMRLGQLAVSLLMFCTLFLSRNASAQRNDLHLTHTGLVGELTYFKQTAETHALRVFNHKGLSDSVKSIMITKYNHVRTGYEQLLLQLIADMHVKKRLFYFKCLDKYFRTGKKKKRGKVSYFIANWEKIKASYDDMIAYPQQAYLDSMTSAYEKLHPEPLDLPEKEEVFQQDAPIKLDVLDPIGSLGSLFKIYRKLQLGDEQKTSNIAELLNTLRLRHPSELIAKDEDEVSPPPRHEADPQATKRKK